MNANQIKQALVGVGEGCLDPQLKYNNVYAPKWVNEDRLMVNDSHAAKIQEASMVEWLLNLPRRCLHIQQNRNRRGEVISYVVHLPPMVTGTAVEVPDDLRKPWSFIAPTHIEALAQACRSLEASKEQPNDRT
jgi:hypothetical protein